ncbi:hypothetical protein BN2364_0581 [Alloalcanivorax xenomutans]|nr:hypothetical protein BN2364_0581 [Alloalcanivorax xenomutans]
MIANQEDQYPAGDPQRWQSDAEQIENGFAERREQQNDHKGDDQRFGGDVPLLGFALVPGETSEHRCIGDRVHDREERQENGDGMLGHGGSVIQYSGSAPASAQSGP